VSPTAAASIAAWIVSPGATINVSSPVMTRFTPLRRNVSSGAVVPSVWITVVQPPAVLGTE